MISFIIYCMIVYILNGVYWAVWDIHVFKDQYQRWDWLYILFMWPYYLWIIR